MNNQQSVLTLVPGTTLVTTRITATQSCSGVGSVASGLVVGTTRLSDDVPFLRASTDAFRSVWASSNPLTPANAGAYRMPTAIVAPRYASFVLTDVWKLVGKSDFVGTPTIVTGPWSTKVLYVQRATTQVTAASRTSVAKGGKVTFRSTLRKAGTTAYIAAAGASMAFQTKLPGGAWQTRARVSTNASGVATYTFAPPRTMSWRWVHAGTRTGSFTAPSISAAKTIKVL